MTTTVLATVKEVAEIPGDFEIVDDAIPEDRLRYRMNERDECALEEAVRIAGDDCEVVTVTIGPERAEETVRTALEKGADRAIRVWDDALAAPRLLDVATRVAVLAAVVEAEAPEMVLTGARASDDGFAATGVALAHAVDYAWASGITRLDLDRESDVASVYRELEEGVEELTDVDLPAVFAVRTAINDPRRPDRGAERATGAGAIAVRSLDDLGVAVEGNELELVGMTAPGGGDAAFLEGDPEEQAARLADVLRDREVVEE